MTEATNIIKRMFMVKSQALVYDNFPPPVEE